MTGARSERKQSTKQSHQSAVLTLLKVGQSERDPARPEKCAAAHCHVRVAGFSVVLAKENAAFDAFVKEEVAPRHSHLGRR